MYPLYRDLREKLGEPLWHDQHGVPRYAEFHPSLLGIYDEWAALFVVECQSCGRTFPCAKGISKMSDHRRIVELFEALKTADGALYNLIVWGDAPWHDFEGNQASFDSQCAGTTMTTSVVDILQLWHRDREWSPVAVEPWMIEKHCEESDHGYERAGP